MDPEIFWDYMLSRDREKVIKAYDRLKADEKTTVILHLKRMSGEDGWHEEQRKSASFALKVLNEEQS